MTFADELRNGTKRNNMEQNEWMPSFEDRRMVKVFLEQLKNTTLALNKKGEHSFKGYLAYCGYDKDYLRTISTDEKIMLEDLGANGLGVTRNNGHYFKFLRDEINAGLKGLGFSDISVKPVQVQLYKREAAYFFREWKIVKAGLEETLKIEFSW